MKKKYNDRRMYRTSKRRSYTIEFKLKAVEYAEKFPNEKAAKCSRYDYRNTIFAT